MSTELTGKTFAFLCASTGVEQVELTEPWRHVTEAGGTPVLVAPEGGRVQAFESDVNKADTFDVDRTLEQASVEDFDGLVLPGGTMNPDQLRLQPEAVEFVRGFVAAEKPVGGICHGPWMLVEADVVKGKTLTSWPSLRTDIGNAGGTWVDEQVFTCGARGWTLVTSRKPGDLDAFCRALVDTFGQS